MENNRKNHIEGYVTRHQAATLLGIPNNRYFSLKEIEELRNSLHRPREEGLTTLLVEESIDDPGCGENPARKQLEIDYFRVKDMRPFFDMNRKLSITGRNPSCGTTMFGEFKRVGDPLVREFQAECYDNPWGDYHDEYLITYKYKLKHRPFPTPDDQEPKEIDLDEQLDIWVRHGIIMPRIPLYQQYDQEGMLHNIARRREIIILRALTSNFVDRLELWLREYRAGREYIRDIVCPEDLLPLYNKDKFI